MSSLKMTFSLASLVLILGLVFAMPVMAQEIISGIGDGHNLMPLPMHAFGVNAEGTRFTLNW